MKKILCLMLVLGLMGCNLFAAQQRSIVVSGDAGNKDSGSLDSENFDAENLDTGIRDTGIPDTENNDVISDSDASPTMAAPVLESAVRSGDNYILTFNQPVGTLDPEGGYDTFVNTVDQSDNEQYSGFVRTITGLSTAIEQCFFLESRYVAASYFPQSNQICVSN